jgi:hypothetical protein
VPAHEQQNGHTTHQQRQRPRVTQVRPGAEEAQRRARQLARQCLGQPLIEPADLFSGVERLQHFGEQGSRGDQHARTECQAHAQQHMARPAAPHGARPVAVEADDEGGAGEEHHKQRGSEHWQRVGPEPFGPGEGLGQVVVHAGTLLPVAVLSAFQFKSLIGPPDRAPRWFRRRSTCSGHLVDQGFGQVGLGGLAGGEALAQVRAQAAKGFDTGDDSVLLS